MSNDFILGQYRIGKSIGQGTFGKVRLGIHTTTAQKVAVKTLQKQKIVEQADIQRVTRQICILKILRHPNVIQLYEIIQTKTDIHLIMQYAQGGQLFDHIVKRKRIDQKQSVKFMQQILSGVQYIHRNGIVHRDLKPQNLLLDHSGNIKIVDFGLSNQYKPGQKLKTACGSPCYAAPQMIAGKKYQCLNADIWSCGIILYAMLCGFLPFEDPNTSKLYKKIMAGQYETPRILSTDSKDILKGILNTNPDKRFGIKEIRNSKWYTQIGKNYAPAGIVVGKDPIEVDERLLKKMAKYLNSNNSSSGVDMSQAKTYIENNKHNQSTALYYLLKVKADRDPSFLQQKQKKRQESPLIHRPQQKQTYYMPLKNRRQQRDKDHPKDNSRNDSLNVSNIISSLVQANKGRLVGNTNNNGMRFGTGNTPNTTKKQTNFDKLEEFKLFPNKKNSSIYEPRLTDRSYEVSREKGIEKEKAQRIQKAEKAERQRQQKIQRQRSQRTQPERTQRQKTQKSQRQDKSQPKNYPSQKAEQGLNKKRQELSQQLRQISSKIDQEISQLRKQNHPNPSTNNNSSASKPPTIIPSNANSSFNQNPTTPTSSITKKRQSLSSTSNALGNNSRIKTQQNSITTPTNMTKSNYHHYSRQQHPHKDTMSASRDKDILNSSRGKTNHTPITIPSRDRDTSNNNNQNSINQTISVTPSSQTRGNPKTHTGPFNTQCIFMENPRSLIDKITSLLLKLNVPYQQPEAYTLTGGGLQLSIESVQGISGLHLIKFQHQHPLNQTVLEVLTR